MSPDAESHSATLVGNSTARSCSNTGLEDSSRKNLRPWGNLGCGGHPRREEGAISGSQVPVLIPPHPRQAALTPSPLLLQSPDGTSLGRLPWDLWKVTILPEMLSSPLKTMILSFEDKGGCRNSCYETHEMKWYDNTWKPIKHYSHGELLLPASSYIRNKWMTTFTCNQWRWSWGRTMA